MNHDPLCRTAKNQPMAFVSCADCEVILQAEKRGEYKAVVDFMSNHDWMYKHGVEDCIDALRELLSKGPSNE